MPSPQLSPAAAALAAIASLQGTIAMARALVVSGRRVDLTGLEREAERLCAAIACLSGARPALEAPLVELTLELDRLTAAMPRA